MMLSNKSKEERIEINSLDRFAASLLRLEFESALESVGLIDTINVWRPFE